MQCFERITNKFKIVKLLSSVYRILKLKCKMRKRKSSAGFPKPPTSAILVMILCIESFRLIPYMTRYSISGIMSLSPLASKNGRGQFAISRRSQLQSSETFFGGSRHPFGPNREEISLLQILPSLVHNSP